jgi:hypothetical protein
MKCTTALISFLLFFFLFAPQIAFAQKEKDLVGNWNAEAPTAPEGFQTSLMQITKDSVFTTFPSESYKYPSTFRIFKNDTLTFDISGLEVKCTLTFESKTKLKGDAIWPDGQSIVRLTKIENPETKDSK